MLLRFLYSVCSIACCMEVMLSCTLYVWTMASVPHKCKAENRISHAFSAIRCLTDRVSFVVRPSRHISRISSLSHFSIRLT